MKLVGANVNLFKMFFEKSTSCLYTKGNLLPKTLNVAKLNDQETKEAIQSQLSSGLGDLSVDQGDIGSSWHNFSNIVYSVSK